MRVTYATIEIKHQISCNGNVVTLETAYAYPQYYSGCPAYEVWPPPPPCNGNATPHQSSTSTQHQVTVTATDKYRTYQGSDFVCQTGSTYGYGNFSFNKLTSAEACQ